MMRTDENAARRRSDGARTHAMILEAAARLASVEGIHGVTLGRLAAETGVSKSGLYAHFGSKEQLQLEAIDAALAIFAREVVEPAFAEPPGMRRLEAMFDAYFSYLERWVFPGGCFFAALLAEIDARPGPLRDRVAAIERDWIAELTALARDAQERGEIRSGEDLEQLVFELYAALELTNYHFVLFRDESVLVRGRNAVRGMLARIRDEVHG